MEQYDLVVLGTGTAGGTVAHACRAAGWSVAQVENRSPGGTCAQRGCDAKKPLVNAAAFAEQVRRLQGKGLAGNVRIDWPELIAFKRTFTDPVAREERERLAAAGIDLIEGEPHFLDERTLAVNDRTLRAGTLVIATGYRPRPLEWTGADLLVTSDEFLELESIPERVAFVGGGYIAFEFGHILARMGREVTILERSERPLGQFDADVVAVLTEASRAAGITLHTGTCVDGVLREGDHLTTCCSDRDERHAADLVVHAAGRVPSIDTLDLAKAAIRADEGGIVVNDRLQSVSNPRVYAVGDVAATPGLPLTPVANLEAAVLAHNLLHGDTRTPDYRGTASVVFTTPPLATVGLTEREAREQGLDVDVRFERTESKKSMRLIGLGHAAYKVLVEKGTERIVGAHVLAHNAQETINAFAIAVRHGLTARQLHDTMFAYPTYTATVNWMLTDY